MKYRVILENVNGQYRPMLPEFPWLNIQMAASRDGALNLVRIALTMYLPTIEEVTVNFSSVTYRVVIETISGRYQAMLKDYPWIKIQQAASRNEALNLAKIALSMYLPTIEETTVDFP